MFQMSHEMSHLKCRTQNVALKMSHSKCFKKCLNQCNDLFLTKDLFLLMLVQPTSIHES